MYLQIYSELQMTVVYYVVVDITSMLHIGIVNK